MLLQTPGDPAAFRLAAPVCLRPFICEQRGRPGSSCAVADVAGDTVRELLAPAGRDPPDLVRTVEGSALIVGYQANCASLARIAANSVVGAAARR